MWSRHAWKREHQTYQIAQFNHECKQREVQDNVFFFLLQDKEAFISLAEIALLLLGQDLSVE